MFKDSVAKSAGIISLVFAVISAYGMIYLNLTKGDEGQGLIALLLDPLSFLLALASFFTGILGLFQFKTLWDRLFALVGLLISTGAIIYFINGWALSQYY